MNIGKLHSNEKEFVFSNWETNNKLALKIWKIKYVIDVLENQDYEQYIVKEQFSQW